MPVALRGCVLAVLIALMAACGGGGGGASNPAGPSGSGGTTTAAVTVSISGQNGAQSLAPNPLTGGTTVAWKNNSSEMHHIVFADSSVDTGDINPGATTRAFTVGSGAVQYHCTIHPAMVGSVNTVTQPPPSTCTDPYGC